MGNIVITLPDGSNKELPANSNGLDLANSIGPKLAKDSVAVVVNGIQSDLSDILPDKADVSIITKDSDEGVEIMRHTLSALVLALAVKILYPDDVKTLHISLVNGSKKDKITITSC